MRKCASLHNERQSRRRERRRSELTRVEDFDNGIEPGARSVIDDTKDEVIDNEQHSAAVIQWGKPLLELAR